MSKISPLAFIDPEAKIGENCEIGPFCFIDKNVVIGDNNVLMNSVTLLNGTRMGHGNTIFPGAVIGAIPQDLKFKGEETTAEIGDNNTIRENVTIHRGTASKGKTVVGSRNLIMENAHIAHDCEFGSGIIMGNSSKLGGEVVVDDNAIISAVVLVHQFCHIGGYTMVQGGSRTSKDIPPFIIVMIQPDRHCLKVWSQLAFTHLKFFFSGQVPVLILQFSHYGTLGLDTAQSYSKELGTYSCSDGRTPAR